MLRLPFKLKHPVLRTLITVHHKNMDVLERIRISTAVTGLVLFAISIVRAWPNPDYILCPPAPISGTTVTPALFPCEIEY